MDQSTHELREHIEDTRSNLANDINELHDKLSPSAIVDRRKEAAKDKVSSVKEKIMGTVSTAQDSSTSTVSSAASSVAHAPGAAADTAVAKTQGNPLAAGVVAFGLGMLASSLVPASSKEAVAADKLKQKAQDHSGPVMDTVKSAAADLGASLQGNATEAMDKVKASAEDSKAKVAQEAKSSAETVKQEAKSDSNNSTSAYISDADTGVTSETYSSRSSL